MKDAFGNTIYQQDRVVYATLTGHKPIMNRAIVLEVEDERIKVKPEARSIEGWRAPDGFPVRWLHQAENVVKISTNV